MPSLSHIVAAALSRSGRAAGIPLTSDQFTRTAALGSSATDIGLGGTPATWVEAGGTLATSSGVLNSNTGAGQVTAVVDSGLTDISVSLKVVTRATTNSRGIGVTARYVDANNYYMLYAYLSGGAAHSLILSKYVAGVETSFDVGAAIANGDTIKLTVIGTTLTAYVNGTLRVTQSDSALQAGTKAGVVSFGSAHGATADDFLVATA